MNAGKDLDVLIAKKVMGLDPMRAGPDDTIFTIDRDWVMPGEYWIYEEGRGYDHVPAYSTDLSAAWLVVDKIGLFRTALMAQGEITGRDDEWVVYKERFGIEWEWHVIGSTPAHAICLAALKVMGIEPV